MEKEVEQLDAKPFSYDILDEEASKISSLILAINQKCANRHTQEVARELFEWAEQLTLEGRGSEAEFLYLHAINLWERHHKLPYPITFVSLKHHAAQLLNICVEPNIAITEPTCTAQIPNSLPQAA